jgi:hypothetical protein
MVPDASVPHSLRMTSFAAQTSTTLRSCCRRPMSTIEVTTRGVTLVLNSCTACGRHLWEKDGQTADRAELLNGVKTFLEQPRMPTPRRSSKRKA